MSWFSMEVLDTWSRAIYTKEKRKEKDSKGNCPLSLSS